MSTERIDIYGGKATIKQNKFGVWQYLKANQTKCDGNEFGPNISKQYSSADIVMLASHWSSKDIETLSLSIPKMLEDSKKVIVVGSTPQSKNFGEQGLNRFDKFLLENIKPPSASQLKEIEEQFFKDYERGQYKVNEQLSIIVDGFKNPNVVFKARSDFMCEGDEQRCYMYIPQKSVKVLWDYGHTTTDGARILGRLITEKQWLSDFLRK